MFLYQPILVEVECHFGIDCLLRSLALEWYRTLENVVLGQVQRQGVRRRVCQDVLLQSFGLGEDFWQPVELGMDILATLSNADGVVKFGIVGVVAECLGVGIELV